MKNPGMDRQTETIMTMVESYLKIVGKTIRDLVPKYIMLLVVLDVSFDLFIIITKLTETNKNSPLKRQGDR